MAKQSRRVGRPRSNDSRVYGSGGTEIPYMRKDKAGNYYTRWKDDNGGWHKKNAKHFLLVSMGVLMSKEESVRNLLKSEKNWIKAY